MYIDPLAGNADLTGISVSILGAHLGNLVNIGRILVHDVGAVRSKFQSYAAETGLGL